MRLERHLAKTPGGLAVRIAQRLLALTLGLLLNTLTGRPARAPRSHGTGLDRRPYRMVV
jgi:hypothetical protein